MEDLLISNIDEYDTFDAYYSTPISLPNEIVIPYINVGLSAEHPFNPLNEFVYVNFCYLKIVEPKYISVFKKGILVNKIEEYKEENSIWIGGGFLGDNIVWDGGIEIQAKDVVLIMKNDFRYSKSLWIPDYKYLKGKGNITEDIVINFFTFKGQCYFGNGM